MAPRIRAPRGTRDIIEPEVALWQEFEARARDLFHRYGYVEIRVPVFEDTALFVRGIGETTDIVEKEMYTLETGEDASVTLRPEATASVVRAYVEHNLDKTRRFRKFYYIGPMFRYERPQAGRQRQFHQMGVEALGSDDPRLDAETIALGCDIFAAIGLEGVEVKLNSMGCPDCRAAYRDLIKDALAAQVAALCDLCKARLERNVFRIFDCKNPRCGEVASVLPPMTEHLDRACAGHFGEVRRAIEALGVDYSIDPQLARGLDYYRRTVYEFHHPGIGARSAVGGGGRYDGLVAALGGPDIPGIGFALGMEATLLALENSGRAEALAAAAPGLDLYVASVDDETRTYAAKVLEAARTAGLGADADYEGRSLKAQLRTATKIGARASAVVGPEEEAASTVKIKDLETGEETTVGLDRIAEAFKD
jgi:histidyl-tRNA synthetase